MATATTTTVTAVKSAFVTAAAAEVPPDVQVSYGWPGADATRRMVFLTDVEFPIDGEEAAVKTGRRHRNEEYDANFEVWCFPDDGPADPQSAELEATAIWTACAEAVVKAGSAVREVPGVWSVECARTRMEPVTFEKAWAIVITGYVNVKARLT